jgi:hypothetical protein
LCHIIIITITIIIRIMINLLMPVQQHRFTHLRGLLELTDRGIFTHSD